MLVFYDDVQRWLVNARVHFVTILLAQVSLGPFPPLLDLLVFEIFLLIILVLVALLESLELLEFAKLLETEAKVR